MALNKVMYVCNQVPTCCVLNGLKCEPQPKKLDN